MRLLFVSDTQTRFSNLPESEIMLEELLAAAEKHRPDAVIHAGDAKEEYDPISTLVVKFWVKAVRRIKDAGFRFIMLKGNHDRISQSTTAKDWLDILRAAGAETVSQPRIKVLNGEAIGFLPFTGDKKQERAWAQQLVQEKKKYGKGTSVLVFHTELAGATLNSAGLPASGNSTADLGMDKWTVCLGGHLHGHQQVGDNVWYIGSPFTQDWGEANAKKGCLLLDASPSNVKMKRIITTIPHWYDVDYLENNGIVPEKGAYIRSRVPVLSKKVQDKMREEEARLRLKYGPDVRLYVIPKLEQLPDEPVVLKGASDKEKIFQYVAATIPEGARFSARAVAKYLLSKMLATMPEGRGPQLKFLKIEASNVLLFPEIEFSYDKQGLVLLRGKNLDWHKRSNGAGKTSALSLLPIALFGQTLKGQKADAWASERDAVKAIVKLTLRDEKNQRIEITRTRRPHGIRLHINGADKSTGIRGTGKEETQGKIQQLVGYDMRMLQNAIYIDQTIANGFVFGSEADRMQLIGRFQDLDRFDKARDAVNDDIKKSDGYLLQLHEREENLQEECERIEEEIKDWQAQVISEWSSQVTDLKKSIVRLEADMAKHKARKKKFDAKQVQIDALDIEVDELANKVNKINAFYDMASKQLKVHQRLVADEKCYVCQQPAQEVGQKMLDKDQADMAEMEKMSTIVQRDLQAKKAELRALRESVIEYNLSVSSLDSELRIAKTNIANAERGAAQEAERNTSALMAKEKLERTLIAQRRYLVACQAAVKAQDVDSELLLYAKRAFSRDGIPLYIASSLCPLLNNAAEEFSELFFDGVLKIRFSVEDGAFRVDVVNSAGSDTLKGQSVGESAMAGVIAAFALREVAPKTNLLILDEPGAGLDAEGARLFARGLLKLKNRYDTILLTTHSPIIEGVLSGETTWTVEKQNGYSRLLQ
jgi:DNA repair exonuclease SbcCD nuclease subunit